MDSDSNKRTNMCPKCGYEYEPWVEVCPDCGTPLVSRPDPGVVTSDEDPQWTIVTNVPNAIIGSLIKHQLEDAGIPVIMMRSGGADIGEFTHNDYVSHDLRVPRRFWQQARELIYAEPDHSGPGEADEGIEEETENADLPPDETYLGYGMPETWRRYSSAGRGGSLRDMPTWEASEYRDARAAEEWMEGSEDEDDQWGDRAREPIPFPRAHREPVRREWHGQPNWMRIVYGILIAAISLPFILQLLQQIARLLSGK